MTLSNLAAGMDQPPLGRLAARLAALRGWRRAAVSFVLGALSVLGFAPLHLWPLLFLTLPAFIWLLDGIALAESASGKRKPQWRQAGLAGWCFGFGFFAAGLYWTGFAFFVEAEKFAILAPLAVAGFPAALAAFHAVAGIAAIILWRPGVSRIFSFVAVFFAAEWLRGNILTGFPWNLWGYALAGSEALAQSASIFGIYGLTLLALLCFASPAAVAGPAARAELRRWVLPSVALGLLITGWSWGMLRLSDATDETVPGVTLRIVQPNIPQAEKWRPENRQWIFDRLISLSRQGSTGATIPEGVTHVIWPETAVPVLFRLNDRYYASDVENALRELVPPGTSLILGAERVEGAKRPDGRYDIEHVFNSLFIIGPHAGIQNSYDKVHLVPFGEYIPLEFVLATLGLEQITHAKTGFDSGSKREPLKMPGAPAFVPLICYEAIFPTYASGGTARPGWLLNLTNDAWFGVSAGPYQHLHQTRLRAIEQGIPLIRAANTGVSAVIDAYGRVRARLPLNKADMLDHGLPVALSPTPYARWGEKWLILLAFVVFLLYRWTIKVE